MGSGDGDEGGVEREVEEAVEEKMGVDEVEEKIDEKKENMVLMWGYLPGISPQRSPLLSPVTVKLTESFRGDTWKDVCGGGCGFAMATSESGKLVTWGSTDDLGQSYLTSGKHEEIPEAFPLPDDVSVVKAAAGWAHCITVTDNGEVYTWGWKECVPSEKPTEDHPTQATSENDVHENGLLADQENSRSPTSKGNTGVVSGFDNKGGEDNNHNSKKRRRLSAAKQASENSSAAETEEPLSALPCLVSLGAGVRITAVAAGGRHTLVLSDLGQVWGWGYGGEGQLGLGTRIRMVSSPHPISCIECPQFDKDQSKCSPKRKNNSDNKVYEVAGNCIKAIACGGRHSAVITNAGVLLTFGWGLHGQCGQGGTDDELRPTCVSSLLGVEIQGVAAGLWHTVCISIEGGVYAFGGNQFGQLGTGADHAETLPKLLETPCLEKINPKAISCGARHTAVITEGGEVFCWGWNKYGQLGLGDAADRHIPSEVAIEGCRPKNVSCGWWHTLVLAESPVRAGGP